MASAAEKAQVPLRIVTIATFVPAFALCIAHGVRSGSPVPAVGLVPLAFSSGSSIFLLVRQRQDIRRNRKNKQAAYNQQPQDNDAAEEQSTQQEQQQVEDGGDGSRDESDDALTKPRKPVLTFFADVILAAALMVVLVFTWIQTGGSAELAMLAAYATIPLLVNFFIHLYLAVREFSRGLAIPALIQYLAWQVVPGACPDCGRHLRPESTPAMPWFASTSSASTPASPSFFRSFKIPSAMKAWKEPRDRNMSGERAAFLPPWFPGQHRYTDLDEDGNDTAVGHHGDTHHNGAAEHHGEAIGEVEASAVAPYRDDPEAAGGDLSMPTSDLLEEPEEVAVVSKKKKRSQGSLDQGPSGSRVWDT
ncbi:hypothetical protein PG989_010954 [Apiospora arundinis]